MVAKNRLSKRGGQTTVEFSLIVLPFFLLIFAAIDYAQIYFYDNAMQNAMREAARFATAGRVIQVKNPDGTPATETNLGVSVPKAISSIYSQPEASRNECIRYWFLSNCVFTLPITNINIVSAPVLAGQNPVLVTNNGVLALMNTNGGTPNPGPGAANDYIQITAVYYVSTITPLFGYLSGYGRDTRGYKLRVSAIVKNEPALLNFQHTNIYPSEPVDMAHR